MSLPTVLVDVTIYRVDLLYNIMELSASSNVTLYERGWPVDESMRSGNLNAGLLGSLVWSSIDKEPHFVPISLVSLVVGVISSSMIS